MPRRACGPRCAAPNHQHPATRRTTRRCTPAPSRRPQAGYIADNTQARSQTTTGAGQLLPALALLQLAVTLPTRSPTPTGAVAGVVQDGTAGRGLSGVEVTGDDRLAALTDTIGAYRLAGLTAGPHQLRF